MTVMIQVVVGKTKRRVLFPAADLRYGSILSVGLEDLKRMENIGIRFRTENSAGILVGTINQSETGLINMSQILSVFWNNVSIFVVDRKGKLFGLWQGGFWFDEQSCDLEMVQDRFKGRVKISSQPIILA